MNYEKLSKLVSHMLRHNPEEYDLILDKYGWISVDILINAIRSQGIEFQSTEITDLERMIENSKKQRHEISNNRIRAIYGHSVKIEIEHKPCEPPEYLYHGTTLDKIEQIIQEGLKPMSRQFVHLSSTIKTAETVAKRRNKKIAILKINAELAWKSGYKFYHGNNDIWLSNDIPKEFLEKIK